MYSLKGRCSAFEIQFGYMNVYVKYHLWLLLGIVLSTCISHIVQKHVETLKMAIRIEYDVSNINSNNSSVLAEILILAFIPKSPIDNQLHCIWHWLVQLSSKSLQESMSLNDHGTIWYHPGSMVWKIIRISQNKVSGESSLKKSASSLSIPSS